MKEYELDRDGQRIYRLGTDLMVTNEDIIEVIYIINKYTKKDFQFKYTEELIPEDIEIVEQCEDGSMLDIYVQGDWDDISTEYLISYLADDLTIEAIQLLIKSNWCHYNADMTPSVADYNRINIELMYMNENLSDDIKLWLKLNYY